MPAATYLRHRIVIESPPASEDALGQRQAGPWAEVCRCWADIASPNGLQTIKADAELVTTKVSIRIRFRDGLQPGMHARHVRTVNGVEQTVAVYDVKVVLPDQARRQHVDLVAELVQ